MFGFKYGLFSNKYNRVGLRIFLRDLKENILGKNIFRGFYVIS